MPTRLLKYIKTNNFTPNYLISKLLHKAASQGLF